MQMSTTHSSFDQYCISHKTILSSSRCCTRPWSPPWVPHDIISIFAPPRNKFWRRHCSRRCRVVITLCRRVRVHSGGEWSDTVALSSIEFILPMLALVGVNLLVIVGNVMVIAAVFTHSKLRSTTTNKFVVSLAVADLMVGLVVLPFSSVNQVIAHIPSYECLVQSCCYKGNL